MPSQDRVKTLVLDTAPLLTSSLTSLLQFSNRFVTTRGVIEEVRGKGQRERLEQEWKILDATLSNSITQNNDQPSGLQIREPSLAGISKVKEFATKTGDIAVLSGTDINVLALAYDTEVDANGTWRLRDTLGGRRMGKDPEKKKERQLRKLQQQQQEFQSIDPAGPSDNLSSSTTRQPAQQTVEDSEVILEESKPSSNHPSDHAGDLDQLVSQTSQIKLDTLIDEPQLTSNRQSRKCPAPPEKPSKVLSVPERDGESTDLLETASDADWTQVPMKNGAKASDAEDESSDSSSFVSVSDPSWITPENVHIHQAKHMGLMPPLHSEKSSDLAQIPSHSSAQNQLSDIVTSSTVGKDSEKPPTMQAALLTGDFAMQNVALQIGLNVLGVNGKRIRDIKTWVLRCYGCFKLCKDPVRKFCPTCGGATLTRVSITYTPSSPTGYVLHLNPNYQYRNRGTVYSIPSAKPGSASFEKGGAKQNKSINGATLVLREDQKEFQNGLKSIKIQKQKEERKLRNARDLNSNSYLSPLKPWNDPEWEPPMLLGEKGRNSAGNHHSNHSIRYGKDGFPLIGYGRNPNEVRRCSKR